MKQKTLCNLFHNFFFFHRPFPYTKRYKRRLSNKLCIVFHDQKQTTFEVNERSFISAFVSNEGNWLRCTSTKIWNFIKAHENVMTGACTLTRSKFRTMCIFKQSIQVKLCSFQRIVIYIWISKIVWLFWKPHSSLVHLLNLISSSP